MRCKGKSQSYMFYLDDMARKKERKKERKKSSRRNHNISSSSPSIIPTPTPTTTTTTTTTTTLTTTDQPIRQTQQHLSNRTFAAQHFLDCIGQRVFVRLRLRPAFLVKAFRQVYSLIRGYGGRSTRILTSRSLAAIRFMPRGTVAVVRRVSIAVVATTIVSRTMRPVRRGMLGVIEGELHTFTGRRRLAG